MKRTREEYIALAKGEKPDKQMLCELFGPLVGLEKEWKTQGATREEISLHAFCWDTVPIMNVGYTGFFRMQEPCILEDTREYTISRDEMGRTMKLLKGVATIPLPLDYPVKDTTTWKKVKPSLTFEDRRVDQEALLTARKAQKEGTLITAGIPGGYDIIRELMGDEKGCLAYYDQPDLVDDILATTGDMAMKVLERVTNIVSVDLLHVHEDMAGRSGPLIGPDIVRRFIKPYYQPLWHLVKTHGASIFSQDSDGDMAPLINAFLECGVTCFYPCEPTGNMDMVQIKRKYGSLIMCKGGIDKHVLRKGRTDIRAELEYKMQPHMREGGVVFGLDHRIPNGTPIENYRYYVNTAREILGREPICQDTPGWAQMAF